MNKPIILCIVMFCFNSPAMGATVGQVTITGNVPIACDIVVVDEPGAANITDISTGATNLLVATVTEICNDPDGYTVTMVGTNSGDHTGEFVDTVSGDNLPFTVRYNSIAVPVGGVVTDSSTVAASLDRPVDITYAADDTLTGSVSDTYEETLTFTISAK
jgi:hypothetical protein